MNSTGCRLPNRCELRWRRWLRSARSGWNDAAQRRGYSLMRTLKGPSYRVVVVGAGLAGLAAALHLAGRSREVTVVEREAWPGGRAGRLDVDGYRLDTGPTVLTMPDIIDDTFAAVGETTSSRLDLLAVDPAYRAQFADGSSLDVHSDADRMAAAIEQFTDSKQAAGYR